MDTGGGRRYETQRQHCWSKSIIKKKKKEKENGGYHEDSLSQQTNYSNVSTGHVVLRAKKLRGEGWVGAFSTREKKKKKKKKGIITNLLQRNVNFTAQMLDRTTKNKENTMK